MKKYVLFLFIVSLGRITAQAPVYLNIGSHNETNDPLMYRQVYADYELAKSLLMQVADSVIAHDASWNMQVDANFIRGCIAHDTARTNPNNFLNWADDQTQIEVDPHNHFQPPFINPYNPTDLNHLLVDSCLLGADRTNLGGFIWSSYYVGSPCPTNMHQNWFHYNSGTEAGYKFPGEQWRPTVLWGGGSPGHCDDSNTMGIWKPTDTTTVGFYTHAVGNFETVIGSNCGTNFVIFDTSNVDNLINDVIEVINYAQTIGNASTDFYTLTVMFNFRDINSPGMVDKIAEFISSMDSYVNQNKVIWSTLSEKYNAWYSTHTTNEYFIRQCDDMNLGSEIIDISEMVSIYPNPSCDMLRINTPENSEITSYSIIDISGGIHRNAELNNQVISVNELPNGLYFLVLNMGQHQAIKKLMIQH